MKRYTTFIAALLVIAQLAACGETAGDQTVTTTADDTEPVTTDVFEGIGGKTYDGREFNFLIRETEIDDYFIEAETGDVLDDAVYKRNRMVEDRFDIEISPIKIDASWNARSTYIGTMRNSVMSGSGEYDLIDGYAAVIGDGFADHLFLNLHDVPNLRLDEAWWSSLVESELTVNGKLYAMTGDLAINMWSNLFALYFNKQTVEEFKRESPYDLVKSGKWTFDEFTKLAKLGLSDLNGDGVYDWENDRIGFGTGSHFANGLIYACGVKMITNENDEYRYTFMNDSFVEKYSKLYKLLRETESVKYDDCGGTSGMGYGLYPGFRADRILFLGTAIRTTEDMRDMTGDYGIIPYPLYDENQKDYITYNLGTAYMSVLLSAKNPEMSAVMLEALNAENWKNVIPAYLDTALKGKYSRDEKTAGMIDLVNSASYFDFAFVNASTGTATWVGWNLLNGDENIASKYESARVSLDTKLENLLELYTQNNQ